MNNFQKHALSAYKSNLAGLPSFCRLAMYELFEYVDFESGTVSINSLDLLARTDFHVDSLRGRAKEEITGDTIRNALRAIKKARPDHFIFSTVNQRIVIEMPFIRELYASFHNEKPKLSAVLAGDVAEAKTHAPLDDLGYSDPLLTGELDTILAGASSNTTINAHVKEKPLTNKQQINPEGVSFAELKQPIRRDFYPNAETIELALSHGYVNVTNPLEIKRFITYNLASSTRWADYNAVFICWLERAHENQKSTEPLFTTQQPRKNADERTPYKVSGIRKPTVADSIADNLRIIESIKRQEQQHQQQADDFINGECCETVAVPC